MPNIEEVLAAGWDFECQGEDELAGERWKQYRSKLLPLLVRLTRWSEADGTLIAHQYSFDGYVFENAAEAVQTSSRIAPSFPEVSEAKAKEALFGIHEAWNVRDIESFFSFCVDDLTYWINAGPGRGLVLLGKDQFSRTLKAWETVEARSTPREYWFKAGVITANIDFCMKNLASGQSFTTTHRQLLMFRDEKICRMELHFNGPSTAALISMIKEGSAGP